MQLTTAVPIPLHPTASGTGSVREIPAECLQEAVSLAAQTGLPLDLRVAEAGRVRRVRGPLRVVKVSGQQVTVHFGEGDLPHRWHEARLGPVLLCREVGPTGLSHVLRVFDPAGRLAWSLTGERPPGHPERCGWRQVVHLLDEDDWLSAC